MHRSLERSWHVVFWRGAIAMAFGLAAFAWPILTLAGLVALIGTFVVLDGALAFVVAMRDVRRTGWWSALLAEGVLGVVAGLVVVAWPRTGVLALTWLIAAWAIVTGVLEIVAGFALRRVIRDEWALVLGGAFSVLAGVVLAARPAAGAVALAWLVGVYAFVFGALLVGLSLRLRRGVRRFGRMRHV